MKSKIFTIAAMFLLLKLSISVQAATITSCTLDRDLYKQGETGYVLLTIYNNKDDTIRITEITATIDYFYTERTVYLQTFFTNATLPAEILKGQSSTFHIPFSLPTNIASGYTNIFCRARTELWNTPSQRWYQSDNPTVETVLYIESPYKQQLEQQQEANQQLQDQLIQQQNTINQLEEKLKALQTSYNNNTLLMYVLVAITIALGATMAFLMKLVSRTKTIPSRAPQ